ncbi:MAG: hypothetical protein IJ899_20090 [Blautia sp.]|nr:hypothetical protein [Blautia sp.]
MKTGLCLKHFEFICQILCLFCHQSGRLSLQPKDSCLTDFIRSASRRKFWKSYRVFAFLKLPVERSLYARKMQIREEKNNFFDFSDINQAGCITKRKPDSKASFSLLGWPGEMVSSSCPRNHHS